MKKRIIIGVIGKDIHIVANKIMNIALTNSNYDVCNLGVINTVENFIDAALEFDTDAIIISSLNGEALTWCKEFKIYFKKKFFKKIPKYLGGNLVIGNNGQDRNLKKLYLIGFDRIFNRPKNFDSLLESLKIDLK
jgi:methylaspartate mutase sigma subunit